MKKIGIVGGMGPESTIEYYKKINYLYQDKMKTAHEFPTMVIESINIFNMLALCQKRDYESLVQLLLNAIVNLENAGAEFAVLAANTPHIVFEQLEKLSPLPLISIVHETFKQVKKSGIKTIGLLGTMYTMNEDYFKNIFIKNGITVVVPNEKNRMYLGRKIESELEVGIVKKSTKIEFLRIIDDLVEGDDIEGIVMGCTELPLIINREDINVSYFDTLEIHVEAIVENILRDE